MSLVLAAGFGVLIGLPQPAKALDPVLPVPSPTPVAAAPSAPSPQPTPNVNPPSGVSVTNIATPNADEVIPVVIAYQDGTQIRAQISRGTMFPVGIPPNQPVTVTLYIASGVPGDLVQVGLYDGGQIGQAAPPNTPIVALNALLHVAYDQTVRFNFQSGVTLGIYRALVTIGSKQYLLQFYAVRPRPVSGITPPPVSTPSPAGTPPHS